MKPVLKNKSDQLVDHFIDEVLKGHLKPGDRLPVEAELAEMFNVSRITIREAVKKLSSMNILTVKQGNGTFVSEVTPENYMEPLLPMLMFEDQQIEDLYDVRRSIEGGAAALAAQKATDDDISLIEDYWEEMSTYYEAERSERKSKYAHADQMFHRAVVTASHNHYFQTIFTTIESLLTVGIQKTGTMNKARNASLSEHKKILEAIKSRDARLSEKLMQAHIEKAKLLYIEK